MYKKYFLWLQKIADIDENFNVTKYEENKEEIFNLYNEKLDEKIYEKLDNRIIELLLDKNIKKETEELFNEIIKCKMEIITIEDTKYPRKLLNSESDSNIPFCFITNSKANLNNMNIYIYFNSYYTKFARNLVIYFAKIINEEKANVITEYDSSKLNKVEIISKGMFSGIEEINKKDIFILSNNKYINKFKYSIVDSIILIEARYEKKIVDTIDALIERGISVYVVPSNIFRKIIIFQII